MEEGIDKSSASFAEDRRTDGRTNAQTCFVRAPCQYLHRKILGKRRVAGPGNGKTPEKSLLVRVCVSFTEEGGYCVLAPHARDFFMCPIHSLAGRVRIESQQPS